MKDNINIKKMTLILKVLANEKRLSIIKTLKVIGPLPVWGIAEKIKLKPQATSKHLIYLCRMKIVEENKRGLQVFYSLAKPNDKIEKYIIGLL